MRTASVSTCSGGPWPIWRDFAPGTCQEAFSPPPIRPTPATTSTVWWPNSSAGRPPTFPRDVLRYSDPGASTAWCNSRPPASTRPRRATPEADLHHFRRDQCVVVVVPGRLVDVVGSVVVVDDVVVLDELVVVLEEGAVVVEFGTVVVVPGAVVVVAGPFDTGTTPQGPPEPDRCGTENGLPPGPVWVAPRLKTARA